MIIRVLCAALFAFVPAPSTPSASPSPSVTPTPRAIAHVYTSDRQSETLPNAARTTYVITRAQIERNGYRTIGEALSSIPGVQTAPYGAIGASVGFGVRGSASSDTLVLVDGLPAPGSFSSSVELGNLPTTGVDRIEVVEGGGSTLYGTGAIGGIINIITQRHARSGAVLRYGSFGDQELEIQTNHLQFSRVVAANDYALPDGSTEPNADYESTALHGGVTHRFGSISATLLGGIEGDRLGAPGPYTPGPAPNFSSTSREGDFNANLDLALTHRSLQALTTLQLGGTSQRISFECNATTDPFCFQPGLSLSSEGRLEMDLRNVVSGANEDLLYGIDLSRGVVRTDAGGAVAPGTPSIVTNALAQSAFYVQQSLDERWGRLYYGVRGERDGSFGGAYSPSVGTLVRLSRELNLKANVATAFRAPNAPELYFPGYGVPTLKPEHAKVADLSLVDSQILGGSELTWFTNHTDDFIYPDPQNNYELDQIDHASIQGLTFAVRTRPLRGFVSSLNLTDLYHAENLEQNLRLPNDPVLAANLRLDYNGPASNRLSRAGIDFTVRGAAGPVDPTQPLFYQAAPYTTVNAYASIRAGARTLLTLRGYNLGNERYAAEPGYPMPGRSFAVELQAR